MVGTDSARILFNPFKMIIVEIMAQDSFQMTLVEHDEQRFQIDVSPEKGQEYQTVRNIG